MRKLLAPLVLVPALALAQTPVAPPDRDPGTRPVPPRGIQVGPRPGVAPTPGVPATAAVAAPRPVPLDLNRADAEALERLPGIGSVLARRILAHRESHGPFRRAEELREVPGIGPGRWERLRPLVAAGGA